MVSVKVSICIPAYRQTEYLRKTLESVSVQTFRDFELIVTDDSRDDSVGKVLAEFNFGTRLRYHKNQVRLGSPENWNQAIRLAKGEWIKIMHHDDWFTYPDSLDCFVKEMEKNKTSRFGFSASQSFNASTGISTKNLPDAAYLKGLNKNPALLFFGNKVGAPSVCLFRNPPEFLFDPKLKWVVDVYFYIQMLSASPDFVFIERDLITSASGVSHSVTNECMTREVQVVEYVYLYEKIKKAAANKKQALGTDWKFIRFFAALFFTYDVNAAAVKELTGLSSLDRILKMALIVKKAKVVRRMMK